MGKKMMALFLVGMICLSLNGCKKVQKQSATVRCANCQAEIKIASQKAMWITEGLSDGADMLCSSCSGYQWLQDYMSPYIHE